MPAPQDVNGPAWNWSTGQGSPSRPGSSQSSSGMSSQDFGAGINALNDAHSQASRGSRSRANSHSSRVTMSTYSDLAALNLNDRPTSARGSYADSRISGSASVAPSGASSYAPSRSGSYAPSRSGSVTPSRSGSVTPSRSGSVTPSRSGSVTPSRSGSVTPSRSGSHRSRAASVAPSIASSMLRGPESDAGSVWSGGASVAPSDSGSSAGGPGRHRPHVPHQTGAPPSVAYSSAGSVASGASYASYQSGRSGRSGQSGASRSSQRYPHSVASSGTARPPGSTMSGASRASAISTATVNAAPDGNVFWPELRPNLTSDAALHNFTVVCPICATSMRATESSSRNVAKILHCGHMVCHECVIRICANIDGSRDNPNARQPECPLCKEPLGRYPDCSRHCDHPGRIGHKMPKDMEQMNRLPLTMPEGGANPRCCRTCRIINIERLSQRLVRVILNDRKATVRWSPTVAGDEAKDGEYIRIPEMQKFLDILADTVRDTELYRKYTDILSQPFEPPQHAVAEMKDRRRDTT